MNKKRLREEFESSWDRQSFCTMCGTSAIYERVNEVKFAASPEDVPQCAKDKLPSNTRYVVTRLLCITCGGRVTGITDSWRMQKK